MSTRIRILGIDPGSQITGFGVVDLIGNKVSAVVWGSLQTAGNHPERLRMIFSKVGAIVSEYEPDEIAIERVFMHRNADSALKLGQARAAAICGTFGQNATLHEYSPRHIKQAVAGRGSAEKAQVAHMIRMLLGIREDVQPDAADALAVALCHAHERGTHAAIRAAVGQA
jgi:crossover junction endodeoxyribonuclease RuvC